MLISECPKMKIIILTSEELQFLVKLFKKFFIHIEMLLEILTLDCLNIKQCVAHDTIKNNLNLHGGAIFRLSKPKYEITGREDSFYENFVSKSTLKVKFIMFKLISD